MKFPDRPAAVNQSIFFPLVLNWNNTVTAGAEWYFPVSCSVLFHSFRGFLLAVLHGNSHATDSPSMVFVAF